MIRLAGSFLVLLALITHTGCDKLNELVDKASQKIDEIKIDPNTNVGNFSCSTTTANGLVESGKRTDIKVEIAYGAKPYQITFSTAVGDLSTSVPSIVVPRTFLNNSTENKVVKETITIKDGKGNSTTCDLTLTVRPSGSSTGGGGGGTTPGALTCQISATPGSPKVNDDTVLLVKSAGGDGKYQVKYFSPGSDAELRSALSLVSSNEFRAYVKFTRSGLKTPHAVVQSGSTEVVCAASSIHVQPIADPTPSPTPLPQSNPLRCEVVTSINPSLTHQPVIVTALVPSASGVGFVRIADIQSYSGAGILPGRYLGNLSQEVSFPRAGVYPLYVTVRDDAGTTATCYQAQAQTVYGIGSPVSHWGGFVHNLFNDLLGRAPTSSESAYWNNELRLGRHPQSIAMALILSSEYRAIAIQGNFTRVLQRSANASELASWQARLSGGSRLLDVLAGVLASSERFRMAPISSSHHRFAEYLSDELFGFRASSDRISNWTQRSRNYGQLHAAVYVLSLREHHTRLITSWYRTFLKREANSSEIEMWHNQLSCGTSWEMAIAAILGSPEYLRRTQQGIIIVYQ